MSCVARGGQGRKQRQGRVRGHPLQLRPYLALATAHTDHGLLSHTEFGLLVVVEVLVLKGLMMAMMRPLGPIREPRVALWLRQWRGGCERVRRRPLGVIQQQRHVGLIRQRRCEDVRFSKLLLHAV